MRYINISWVCDGLSDCSNSADEELVLCPPDASTSSISPPVGPFCSANDFECVSGQCVDVNLVCDGEYHCADGTDEGVGCSKFDQLLFQLLRLIVFIPV